MKLTNTDLHNYVGRIKLTVEQKRRYQAQIDNLVTTASDGINAHRNLRVSRVLQTGSWRKGTALRPRDGHALDIDLAFFLALPEEAANNVEGLHETLLNFLVAAYPTKRREDFKPGHKTVGLVFKGSGLKVDLVPVVPLSSDPTYVWQPSISGTGAKFVTSIEGQLKFIQAIKERDPNWSSLVRMIKAWRNRQELELSSFAVELLSAHLLIKLGEGHNLEDAVIRFFDFLARPNMPSITFAGAKGQTWSGPPAPIYLADPTYNPNNVLERMTDEEWSEVQDKAQNACELLPYAQSKRRQRETIDLWKEVFGPSFNIEAEED